MATTYGQKGGEGPTKGKRSELIRSPSTGLTKRVFNGQRWLVVSQRDENDTCFITAHKTREIAQRVSDGAYRLGYDVHYVEQAEVAA